MRSLRAHGLVLALLLGAGCSRNAEYYLDKGNRAAAAGNDADAVLNFKKALQKNSRLGQAYLHLGLAYQRQSKLREAYTTLRGAADLLPESDEAQVDLGNICLTIYVADSGHPKVIYDQLNNAANQLLARDADSFDGLRLKGDLALLDHQLDQAIELLQKANQIKPMQANVVLPLVQSLFGNNRPAEAEELDLRMIAKDKTSPAAYDSLYLFYATHNRIADAEKILQRKVENNPNVVAARLQLAEHYSRLAKNAEVVRTLQPLLDSPKVFPEGRLQVGDFYYSIGNAAEAIKQYQAGLDAKADKLVFQKRLIGVWTHQGMRDQATQMVEAALHEHPADEELKSSKATLLLDSGKPENIAAALTIFEELVKQKPGDPARHLNFGRAALLNGDLGRAQTELSEALRLSPGSIPVRALLANISLRKRDFTAALAYSGEILTAEPANSGARLVRTASLLGLGRYKELRSELDRMVAAQPGSVDAQFQLGALNLAEGRTKDAEAAFGKSSGATPGDARSLEGIVEARLAQNQSDSALRLINQEIARAPDSPALRGLLAATALRTGNLDLAIEQYRRLSSENPKAVGLYLWLGEALRAKGEYPDALTQFEKARQIAPRDVRVQVAEAVTENLMGRKNDARDSFRKALATQPDDATIMNNLAYLIVETGGNLQEAQKLAQEALRKQPNQPGFMDTLGWIYQKTGQTESAFHIFDNLVRQYPNNPSYEYHLAMSFVQKGDRLKARESLTAALAQKPNGSLDSDIRQLLSKLN